MPSSTTNDAPQIPILTDLSPLLKVYADGTVHRLFCPPRVPPSLSPTAVISKDVVISSSGLSARLYLPNSHSHTNAKLPIIVYYHGGGFCLPIYSSALGHAYLNVFSSAAAALIVAVEYRIAPEHPLPAAYEDSWECLKWVCSQKDPWITDHGDFTRLFVAGDSAGGNIAHNIALQAGSDSDPALGKMKIRGAIISQPFLLGSSLIGSESRENPDWALLERLWAFVYPGVPGGIDSPWINPLVEGGGSLAGLGCSKMMICAAEKEVLRDRIVAYAEKVKKSGWEGEVVFVEIEGEDHCFHVYDPHSQKAVQFINKMASFIQA